MYGQAQNEDVETQDHENEELATVRQFSDRSIRAKPDAPFWLQIGQALAVFITVAWISYAAIYILALPNSIKTITSSPLTFGGVLASVLAPIAMMWLCIATWQRRSDAHIYAAALREELRGLFYPGEDQSNLISEDIRSLMRQATEMSASSRGAIKAIQRARTGLRAEIRDFAGVSQKAEFHIDRLSDTLSKRAEELLTLTETIELQTENISTKAQKGVGAWENVSAEISELGDEIEKIFDGGSHRLQTASDTALIAVKTIEDGLALAVEGLSFKISTITQNIDVTRDDLDSQATRLLSVSEKLDSGSSKLEESLSDAENIYSAVENVMSSVAQSLNKMEDTTETFLIKSEVIEQKLDVRTLALTASADRLLDSTNGLHEIGDIATNKLGEALSMAISGAETISSAVRRSKDMMDKAVTDATSQMEYTSRIADEKLAALIEEAKINRDTLANLISEIESKQSLLEKATQNIATASMGIESSADKATENLDNAVTRMVNRTEEPIAIMQSSIERLDIHSHDIEDKLSVRIVEVQQETNRLKSILDVMDSTVQNSLKELSTTSAHITNQTKSINDHTDSQRENLNNFVVDLEKKTNDMHSLLLTQKQNLEDSILSSSNQVSTLGNLFIDKGDNILGKIGLVSDKISEYDVLLNQTLQSVDVKYTEVSRKVDGQIQAVKHISDFIAPESDRILSRVDSLYESYKGIQTNCFAVADTTTNCLKDLGQIVEQRVASLGNETASTARIFTMTSDKLAETIDNIKTVAEEARDRISQVQTGLLGRVDDLHLVSDKVQMKVQSLQNNLGAYAKDLNDVLHLSVSEIESATEKYGQTITLLDGKINSVMIKMAEATRQYTEEGHRMSLMGEQALHKSARIVTTIQNESEKLVGAVKSSLFDLQKSGDTLSIRTKEIEEYLKLSTQHTKTYCNELREEASLIANHSSDIVDRVSQATQILSLRASEVKSSGAGIISEIEDASERLENGTNVLGRVAKITIEAVDDAIGGFVEHGNILQSTIHNLNDQIQTVKLAGARAERETFLSSAKFVIESLYSLAIDVSRHLNGEFDIQTLRSYQKGDVSAYVRHLIEISPRMSVEKSQAKFIEDGEFRTYVLRFIRQYEELLIQAQDNDYGDLLSTVFVTSDIGRLYKMLCEIAGRSAKDH